MTRRTAGWIAVLLVSLACLGIGAVGRSGPVTEAERVEGLSEKFACPLCNGESVAESNAAVSATIRDFIRVQVADGASDDEIRDRLVVSYGTDVLLNPPASGVSLLIWILPVVVVVLGAGAVVAVVLRGRETDRATDADRELVDQARKMPAR